jgi:hypothetical protein
LKRSLLGSVSAKVAAEATCSVTVIRPSRAAGDASPLPVEAVSASVG